MSNADKKSKRNSSESANRIVRFLWIGFFGILGLVTLIFTLIVVGAIGYMPAIEDLENPIDKYASQVYSSDDKLIGTYSQSKENRIYSGYDELSPFLVQALVATEDERFYGHSGIDFYAVARAVVKRGIFQQKSSGGGSTISQQLAKQLYSPPAGSVVDRLLQKPIEWVIAVQLERYYTKEEIINLYLNKFDFLNNAVGIQTASNVYFGKKAKDLSIEEAATLVGMCKNPSQFNPVNPRKAEATKGRRNVVLEQMNKVGYVSDAELASLKQLPLALNYNRVDHKDGLAPYMREYLRVIMMAKRPDPNNYAMWQSEMYSNDSLEWETNPLYGWCNKNKKSDGNPYNLYVDGLKIYTSIDSRMQIYAEQAMSEHLSKDLQPLFTKEKKGRPYAPYSRDVIKQVDSLLIKSMRISDRYANLKKLGWSESDIVKNFKQPAEMRVFSWGGEVDTIMTPLDSIRYHKGFLRSGFMAMDPTTGQVKAYVGGIDFRFFQYDMVNKGRRQVGSTIKPYLYTLAMEQGMTPCDQMLYEPQVLDAGGGRTWAPRDGWGKMIGQMVSIQWGLQNSSNWVTAYLMKQTSPFAFVRMLHAFGITGKIDPVVSLALGSADVSIGEMAGAYTAFVNKGIRTRPLYVTRIEDSFGNTIVNLEPQVQEVFSELTSVKMLRMLRAVVDAGTGNRLRFKYGLKAPMGGKTGTTQNNSDGWFMGFTPKLVTATWVGGEDRSIHFDGTYLGQGASMALPVYALFMKKVYADTTLGYSQDDQFTKASSNIDPCAGSSLDSGLIDASDVQSGNGMDDMFH